ncbi:MAG: anthranilate synthase component I family protein [Gloeobacteraceae cyanobacterium ES-bin-316]|nr:anthranilate synthase component I family protein [Ferruginibacter sp.]
MLNWANRFNIFCFLDNNHYSFDTASFESILGAGCSRSLQLQPGKSFSSLQKFYDQQPSWLFGHLGYGLKNEVENLSSRHGDFIDFGIGFFFEPEIVLILNENQLSISSELHDPGRIYEDIQAAIDEKSTPYSTKKNIESVITKEQYLQAVEALKQHIKHGDCYEINYCQQFMANDVTLDPLQSYLRLVKHSPNPFAALYKLDDKYCLCASPERYLKKNGTTLISQPIKGTIHRHISDKVADNISRDLLKNSTKERSENVMVVDLVRNDLSKISKEGSVQVDELFGIYSFPQVHQMISTIRAEMAEGLHWTDVIEATFPMGSMTGAPKKKVMELIDEYEATSRGLFSGSIGYISPKADFDFNVVIRSIFYDHGKKNLSFSAGGGITINSDAEEEYKECMLKASAILKVLAENNLE